MRRLLLAGPHDLRVQDVPDPTPGAGEVVLRVAAAGVCGSDLHGYRGVNQRRRPGTVMGHEVSGTVSRLGPGVAEDWLGREVVVNPVLGCEECPRCREGEPQRCPTKVLIGCVPEHPGGFAELMPAPVTALVPWPGPAPLRWGPLAEPLAVGLHAVRRVDVRGRSTLVIGSGPVAIAAAWAAERDGATVTMTLADASRGALLAPLGLATVLQDLIPPARRYDAVVDCVANEQSLELALRHVAPGGPVVVVGLSTATIPVSIELLVQGDRVLLGSAQYSRSSFARAVSWLASGRLDVAPLLGDPQPLVDGPDLFRTWTDNGLRPLRTLLAPG